MNINNNLFFINTSSSEYPDVSNDRLRSTQTLILTTNIKSFNTINNWAQGIVGYEPKFIQDFSSTNQLDNTEVLYLNKQATYYPDVSNDTLRSTQTLIFTTNIPSFTVLNNWAQSPSPSYFIPTVQEYLNSLEPTITYILSPQTTIFNAISGDLMNTPWWDNSSILTQSYVTNIENIVKQNFSNNQIPRLIFATGWYTGGGVPEGEQVSSMIPQYIGDANATWPQKNYYNIYVNLQISAYNFSVYPQTTNNSNVSSHIWWVYLASA